MQLTDTVARSALGLETVGERLPGTEVDEVGIVGSRSSLARLSALVLASARTVLLNIGRVQSQVAAAIATVVATVIVLTVLAVLAIVLSVLAIVLSILAVVLALTLTTASSSELSIGDSGREEDRENG
jgi:hypothetical protein